MMLPEEVVKRSLLLTEKGSNLSEQHNQVVFEVDRRANKFDVKEAVETLFKVRVIKVRTMLVRGRQRRMGKFLGKTQGWKKAVVSLASGDTIDVYEGV